MNNKQEIMNFKALRAVDFWQTYKTQTRIIASVTTKFPLEVIWPSEACSLLINSTCLQVLQVVMMKTSSRALWSLRTSVSLSPINSRYPPLLNKCRLHSIIAKIMQIEWCWCKKITVLRGCFSFHLRESMMWGRQEIWLRKIVSWIYCSHQVPRTFSKKEIFKPYCIHQHRT